jgi:hypothetical protein
MASVSVIVEETTETRYLIEVPDDEMEALDEDLGEALDFSIQDQEGINQVLEVLERHRVKEGSHQTRVCGKTVDICHYPDTSEGGCPLEIACNLVWDDSLF